MPRGSTGGGTRNKCGRWTRQEHERFLSGLEAVGERWCLVATYVPTRTERQIRTHAQKYLRKVRQGLPFPEQPYESPVESDGDDDDDDNDDNTRASVDGGAAAAADEEPGPYARPPPDSSRHGVPMAAPSFGGREFNRSSDSRNDVWGASGGGHSGGAAPLSAPVATAPPAVNPSAPSSGDNLHGAWLQGGPEHGGPGFRGPEFLPFQGQGADMAGGRFSGGRFSPPEGEAAPFRNWPVADGDRHANLLVEYGIGDMDGRNNHHDNDGDNDGHNDGAAVGAAAAFPRFR